MVSFHDEFYKSLLSCVPFEKMFSIPHKDCTHFSYVLYTYIVNLEQIFYFIIIYCDYIWKCYYANFWQNVLNKHWNSSIDCLGFSKYMNMSANTALLCHFQFWLLFLFTIISLVDKEFPMRQPLDQTVLETCKFVWSKTCT